MDLGFSVLIAEDDSDDAFLLQRALKACGLRRPPHIVHNGNEAIKYLHGDPPYEIRPDHPFPDILILDLKMPGASGFDVLEWINQNPDYRVIPSIIWSASADRRDVKHAFCLGAHAYLCKPSNYEQFVDRAKYLLEFWSRCERPGLEPFEPTCENMKQTHPMAGAHFH